MKGLVGSGGACPKLRALKLYRNAMGRGFRTVPKALGSDVFKGTVVEFDCSYNDVKEDDMR